MGYRCLILLAILIFPGIISSGQSDSTLTHRQVDFNPDLVMQVGAFHQESNAVALKNRLSALLDQSVIMVPEDGFFKVRITGFTTQEELEKILSTLGFLGMGKIWVLPARKQETAIPKVILITFTPIIASEEDQGLLVARELKYNSDTNLIVLQVGVFHDRSKALQAQRIITTKLNLSVKIIQEWEYYKVFVSGFSSIQETSKYYPQLAKLGYPDILLIKDY
jgi:cell division protein FtsN